MFFGEVFNRGRGLFLKRIPSEADFCGLRRGYDDIEFCYSVGNKRKVSINF